MCNDYRLKRALDAIIESFADLKIKIQFSASRPTSTRETTSRSQTSLRSSGPLMESATKVIFYSEGGVGPGQINDRFCQAILGIEKLAATGLCDAAFRHTGLRSTRVHWEKAWKPAIGMSPFEVNADLRAVRVGCQHAIVD